MANAGTRELDGRRGRPSLFLLGASAHALDFGSELEELFVDHFVSTVNMVEAIDLGGAFCSESGKDEGGGGPEVGSHDRSGAELPNAVDDGRATIDADIGTHAGEFGAVHEALGEDGVFDDRDAGGGGKHGGELGLHVGGKTGMWGGGDGAALGGLARADSDAVSGVIELDDMSGFDEFFGGSDELVLSNAVEGNAVVAGHRSGDHKSAGFNAVGNDGVVGASKRGDTFDGDAAGAGAFDFSTHGVEEMGEVNDFGFAGGGFDDGRARGKDGRHHKVVSAEDGGPVSAAEVDFLTLEAAFSLDKNIATLCIDMGTDSLEAFEVEIDGPVADDTAAGNRDTGATETSEKWAHDADGGPHFTNDFVGCLRVNVSSGDLHGAAVALDLAAQGAEDLEHVVGIRDIGDALDNDLLIGQESGGEDGERGVFGAGDINGTGKRGAAVHEKFVHGRLLLWGEAVGFLGLACKWKAGDFVEILTDRDIG